MGKERGEGEKGSTIEVLIGGVKGVYWEGKEGEKREIGGRC